MLKAKGLQNICHANSNQKRAGVFILILNKIDFKIKIVAKDEKGCYVCLKGKTIMKI